MWRVFPSNVCFRSSEECVGERWIFTGYCRTYFGEFIQDVSLRLTFGEAWLETKQWCRRAWLPHCSLHLPSFRLISQSINHRITPGDREGTVHKENEHSTEEPVHVHVKTKNKIKSMSFVLYKYTCHVGKERWTSWEWQWHEIVWPHPWWLVCACGSTCDLNKPIKQIFLFSLEHDWWRFQTIVHVHECIKTTWNLQYT